MCFLRSQKVLDGHACTVITGVCAFRVSCASFWLPPHASPPSLLAKITGDGLMPATCGLLQQWAGPLHMYSVGRSSALMVQRRTNSTQMQSSLVLRCATKRRNRGNRCNSANNSRKPQKAHSKTESRPTSADRQHRNGSTRTSPQTAGDDKKHPTRTGAAETNKATHTAPGTRQP